MADKKFHLRSITLITYEIKFDPRLAGWVGFRLDRTITGRSRSETTERKALTVPKPQPYLAARALARVLKGNHVNGTE